MNTPVAILVRVSTNKQETDRQKSELTAVAHQNGWTVIEVIEEHGVSRRVSLADRPGLARALELAAAGSIRKVLVHEVSRIGRSAVTHPFVESIHEHGVALYWHAQRIETLMPDGRRNQAAGLMLALLAEMAHAEIEILSERIKSGLAEARRKGRRLGRPAGSTVPQEEFLSKHADVQKFLRAGQSIRHTAILSRKGASTVQRVARAMRA